MKRILEVFLPTCSRTKLVGLCKTPWVEGTLAFEIILEIYVVFVTFLDAMLYLHQHLSWAQIILGIGIGIH